jgi:hypothetical protein
MYPLRSVPKELPIATERVGGLDSSGIAPEHQEHPQLD